MEISPRAHNKTVNFFRLVILNCIGFIPECQHQRLTITKAAIVRCSPVALMLIVLGLFPAVSGFVQHIPEPVLGGATLVMFGTIAASGVRIVSREPLNRRAILIIALSLAVGLGVSQQPLILQFAPEWLKNLLSSGIAAGGITAIVLNLIFPPEKQ